MSSFGNEIHIMDFLRSPYHVDFVIVNIEFFYGNCSVMYYKLSIRDMSLTKTMITIWENDLFRDRPKERLRGLHDGISNDQPSTTTDSNCVHRVFQNLHEIEVMKGGTT